MSFLVSIPEAFGRKMWRDISSTACACGHMSMSPDSLGPLPGMSPRVSTSMWDIFAETLFDHLFPVCFLHAVPAKLRRSKQLSMLLRQSQVLNSADKEIKAKLSSRDRLGCLRSLPGFAGEPSRPRCPHPRQSPVGSPANPGRLRWQPTCSRLESSAFRLANPPGEAVLAADLITAASKIEKNHKEIVFGHPVELSLLCLRRSMMIS